MALKRAHAAASVRQSPHFDRLVACGVARAGQRAGSTECMGEHTAAKRVQGLIVHAHMDAPAWPRLSLKVARPGQGKHRCEDEMPGRNGQQGWHQQRPIRHSTTAQPVLSTHSCPPPTSFMLAHTHAQNAHMHTHTHVHTLTYTQAKGPCPSSLAARCSSPPVALLSPAASLPCPPSLCCAPLAHLRR